MWRFLAFALVVGVMVGTASAQLPPEGAPLGDSNFSLDLYRGPVSGTSRMVGLAGAVVAIAEGVEGGLQNPAAVANRPQQSLEWWDYWYGLGFVFPFDSDDFFNSGNVFRAEDSGSKVDFFFFNPGGYLQFYGVGFGINADVMSVRVRATPANFEGNATLRMNVVNTHVQFGYGLLDGQLMVGGGLQAVTHAVRVRAEYLENDTYRDYGMGSELGFLYRPQGKPWRLGVSIFSPVTVDVSGGDNQVAVIEPAGSTSGIEFPDKVALPWRGSLGFAYQFGKRPLNPPVTWDRREVESLRKEVDSQRRQLQQRCRRERQQVEEAKNQKSAELNAIEQRCSAESKRLRRQLEQATREAWRRLRQQMRHRWPRRYMLISSELLIAGRTADAIGVQALLAQRVQRSGESISPSPRLGIEGEPWQRRMKLRAGVYFEPSRFENTHGRVHGTFGFDLRLFAWDVMHIWPEDQEWALTAAIDGTVGYQAFSLGVTGWY